MRLMLASVLAAAMSVASCSKSTETPIGPLAYYVDASSGSDDNSGKSEDQPWKTLAKVASVAVPSGATIYLRRGQAWNEQLDIPSSGITVAAYGTGSAPRIDGSRILSGIWTSEGGGVYSMVVSPDAGEALGNISEDGTMMSFADWNGNLAASLGAAPVGSFTIDVASAKIYIKPAAAPAGKTYRASFKLYGVLADGKSGVTIRDIHVTRFSLNGIYFRNCASCSAISVTVTEGGGVASGPNPSAPPTFIYAGNSIEYDTGSLGGVVDSAVITDIFDSGISPQTYFNNDRSGGQIFRNSTIDRSGFAGVEISVLSNGGTTGSTISNVTMSNLTITHSGQGWSGRRYGTEGHGIRVQADAGAGTISGITLERTTVCGSAGDGVKLAGEIGTVRLDRMSLSDNTHGISVVEPTATSLRLRLQSSLIYKNRTHGVSYNAPSAAGFELLHNTFYDNGTINLGVFNQSGTADLRNNVFFGSAPMTHLYVSATLAGATVNRNCYNEGANIFGYNSAAYSTVAALNAATGLESAGAGGAVDLTSPATGNFTLQSSSICKALGDATAGVSTDFGGYAFQNPPSAGAWQY